QAAPSPLWGEGEPQLQSLWPPSPCPSPRRGEGTLRDQPSLFCDATMPLRDGRKRRCCRSPPAPSPQRGEGTLLHQPSLSCYGSMRTHCLSQHLKLPIPAKHIA